MHSRHLAEKFGNSYRNRTFSKIEIEDDLRFEYVTTAQSCLTHRVRWIREEGSALSGTLYMWCGQIYNLGPDGLGPARWIESADDDFICARCETASIRYGLKPSGKIPDTGCSATGGLRYQRNNPAP